MIRAPRATTLALVLVALAAAAWVTGAGSALELRPSGALRGGWWRVVTCHLAHWSAAHLAWDAGALLLLAAACDRIDPRGGRRLAVALAVAALAIPASVLLFDPMLDTYRGLSGLDSTAFALVAVRAFVLARNSRVRIVAAITFAGFIAKVVAESVTGEALFATRAGDGTEVVPLTHAVGALVGVLVAKASPFRRWPRRISFSAMLPRPEALATTYRRPSIRSRIATARSTVPRSLAGNSSIIAASARTRRLLPSWSSFSPFAVARTTIARRSSGSGPVVTSPSFASSCTRRVMLGGFTCSASASAPSERGPPKTSTESAESFGAERPLAASLVLRRRSRWIAIEWSRSGSSPVNSARVACFFVMA